MTAGLGADVRLLVLGAAVSSERERAAQVLSLIHI